MTISTHSELFINMRQWCSASETLWSRMEDRTASRNQGVRADVKIVDACKQEGGEKKKKKSWSVKLWDPFISSLFWYWYIVNSAGGSYETHLQAAVCTLCNRLFQRTAVISQKLDLSPTRSVTLVLKKKKKNANLAHDSSWNVLTLKVLPALSVSKRHWPGFWRPKRWQRHCHRRHPGRNQWLEAAPVITGRSAACWLMPLDEVVQWLKSNDAPGKSIRGL